MLFRSKDLIVGCSGQQSSQGNCACNWKPVAASTIKSLRGFGAYNLFNEVYLTEFCLRGFGCIHNLNPYTDLFPSSSNSTKNLDSYFSLSPNLSPPFVAPIPQTSQASPVNSSSVPLIPPGFSPLPAHSPITTIFVPCPSTSLLPPNSTTPSINTPSTATCTSSTTIQATRRSATELEGTTPSPSPPPSHASRFQKILNWNVRERLGTNLERQRRRKEKKSKLCI